MTELAVAVTVSAAVSWLGWCWVLVRRESVDATLRLAAETRRAGEASAEASRIAHEVRTVQGQIVGLTARVEDAERRLQSTISRMTMR